jgi:hypothetical protein
MAYLNIHCQPSLLRTIEESGLDYVKSTKLDEIDVIIPYTKEVDQLNNSVEDEELVQHFGLDYDQVNCIELYD